MSTGKIVTYGGTRAQAPKLVVVSDGTMSFPYGHYEYFTRKQPDGMLLLDIAKSEYSEFKVVTDRDFEINLYKHEAGSRYKLFIYRSTNEPITISFANEERTQLINGDNNPIVTVLEVEIAELNGAIVSVLGSQQDTDNITLSKDIQFNGVEQGAFADGSKMNQGDSITNILTKFAQKALVTLYTAPVFGIIPNNQSVEAGTYIDATIIPSFTANDAGALTRYLLELSIGGANQVLVDQPYIEQFVQPTLIAEDGAHLVFTAQAFYNEGITKNNNLGEPDPTNKILAGSKTDTLKYTGYRKLFYGISNQAISPASSNDVRNLANSILNPVNGTTFTINIVVGTELVVFAYPNTLRDLSSVKYEELGNAEVADTFELINLIVEGANTFAAIGYKVYAYAPQVPFGSSATYKITI